MSRKTWSLTARAPIAAGLIVVLVVAIVSLMAAVKEYKLLRRASKAQLEAITGVLASSTSVPLAELDLATLRDLMFSARKAPCLFRATVFDKNGSIITDGSLENLRRLEEIDETGRMVLKPSVDSVFRVEKGLRIAAVAVRSGDAIIGGVECVASTERIRQQSLDLFTSQSLVALLLGGFLGFLVWVWVRKSVIPARQLILSIDRLTGTGKLIPLPRNGPSEIRQIAEAFSRLVSQLRDTTLSRKMLSGILEGIGEGLLVLREDGVIEDSNRVLEEMTGRRIEDLRGFPMKDLLAWSDEEVFRELLNKSLNNIRQTVHGTAELLRFGSETTLPVLLSFRAALKVGGSGFMITCLVQDISESRKIEEMKAQFFATVSHELRTPITSIKGTMDLMAGGAMGSLPDGARRMVEIARINTDRMLMLVNDLLDLEKAESGKLSLKIQVVEFVGLLESSIELAHGFTLSKNLRYLLEAEGPVFVHADPDRVHQVLMNLLSNAARYAPEKTTIRIRLEEKSNSVRVEVIDRGPGVPLAFQKRLFERFAQAGDREDSIKGSGLGLALAHELIERMDGRIAYTEAVGGGALFFFELPLADAEEAGG